MSKNMVQRRMEVEGGELELEDEVMLLPLPSNPHMLVRVQVCKEIKVCKEINRKKSKMAQSRGALDQNS